MPKAVKPSQIHHCIDGVLPDNDSVRSERAGEYSAFSTHPLDLLATPVGLECGGAVQLGQVPGKTFFV